MTNLCDAKQCISAYGKEWSRTKQVLSSTKQKKKKKRDWNFDKMQIFWVSNTHPGKLLNAVNYFYNQNLVCTLLIEYHEISRCLFF